MGRTLTTVLGLGTLVMGGFAIRESSGLSCGFILEQENGERCVPADLRDRKKCICSPNEDGGCSCINLLVAGLWVGTGILAVGTLLSWASSSKK